MGEEQKEDEKKEEPPKEEEKKEEELTPPEIVLKVDMHCEACARKVARSLRKFEGVEDVKADSRAKTVVIKAKTVDIDPNKVRERVEKKTHKKVELISPLPKEEEKKEEEPPKEEETPPPPPEEKKEEPKTIAVVLRVRLHCEACAQVLQKRIKKMEGVETVETDFANDQIIVKGINIDPNILVENVYKKTRRQAFIQEEKKEEEPNKEEEKKEEEPNKEEEEKEINHEEEEIKKYEFWPGIYNNNNHMQYAHPYPMYNHNYPLYQPYQPNQVHYDSPYMQSVPVLGTHYGSYVPVPPGPVQVPDDQFSDENPNACSVM